MMFCFQELHDATDFDDIRVEVQTTTKFREKSILSTFQSKNRDSEILLSN